MNTPAIIRGARVDLVIRKDDVRINEPGLPAGHALRVVAKTPDECLELARALEYAAAVLRNLGAK